MTRSKTQALVAMAILAASLPVTSADTTGMCTTQDVRRGILYYAMPGQCEKYVQCQHNTPVVRTCPYMLVWDARDLTCVPVSMAACNPCQNAANGAEVRYGFQCNTYWSCNNGLATARCCPSGYAFSEGSGCVPDPSCTPPCPSSVVTTTTQAPCPLQASQLGPQFYQQFQNLLGWVDRPCPAGTRFTLATCGCHTIVTAEPYVCSERLDLQFRGQGYVDMSMHQQWLQVSNVQLSQGTPLFNGVDSEVAVFGLDNVPFSPNALVSVTFLPRDLAPASAKRVLLQLSRCEPSPDVLIFVTGSEAAGHNVSFTVRGRSAVAGATLFLQPGTYNVPAASIELPFASDPSKVYFELSDRSNGRTLASTTADFSGSISRTSGGGLFLGNGDCTRVPNAGFAPFSGLILETRITTCHYGEI